VALGRLSALQERVLVVLSGLKPAWTLTGGGALAGFHTKHRETRDIDLFFRGELTLGALAADAKHALEADGLTTAPLQTSSTFAQLDVRSGADTVVVDLVADPTPIAEAPVATSIANTHILVETPYQLLVNKLCALLSRSELRDLIDVRALADAGIDIDKALVDCPKQDAGFSPLTFGWSVKSLPIDRLARRLGWPDDKIAGLIAFRDQLVDQVVAAARP